MTPYEVFCQDLVDISYDNASFSILEVFMWLQPTYFFLISFAFWFLIYIFPIDWDNLNRLTQSVS